MKKTFLAALITAALLPAAPAPAAENTGMQEMMHQQMRARMQSARHQTPAESNDAWNDQDPMMMPMLGAMHRRGRRSAMKSGMMGPGMMGGGMMGKSMMPMGAMMGMGGPMMGNGPMAYPMLGFATGKDKEYGEDYAAFLKATREKRRRLWEMMFDYREAMWNPDTTLGELKDLAARITSLRAEIDAARPQQEKAVER